MPKQKINAIIIIEAIADAKIPDEIKLQAIDDFIKMYTDPEYFHKCYAAPGYVDTNLNPGHLLAGHHSWCFSDLGITFWIKMETILL